MKILKREEPSRRHAVEEMFRVMMLPQRLGMGLGEDSDEMSNPDD